MPLDDLRLEIGKSYNIDYVIKELEKAPEVQLGHIVISMTHEHKYHINKLQLEELSKKIKTAIAKGGKEYEKVGKKFVPLTEITILSIIDPYVMYEKYNKFYTSFEPQIVKGIEESKKNSVAAPTDAIINEARKIGIVIEKEEEFLDGMGIFFKRRGIVTSPVSGGKYILFEKIKPSTPREVREVIASDIDAAEREYEKYSVYTDFYDDFYKQIVQGIETSKKEGVAASVNSIIDEAQKRGCVVIGKERDFLRGMELYFKIRRISIEEIEGIEGIEKKYLFFRRVG